MNKVIVVSSLVTSAVWVAFTSVLLTFMVPAAVDAQVSRIQADDLVIGAAGAIRAHVGPSANGLPAMEILDPDGKVLERLAAGGDSASPDPTTFGLTFPDVNASGIIRIGTGVGGRWDHLPVVGMADHQGKVRVAMALDATGSPSIQMFDADGNVIWSAP